MNSREKILSLIKINKPMHSDLPAINMGAVTHYPDQVVQFTVMLKSIGGEVKELESMDELESLLNEESGKSKIIINAMNDLNIELNVNHSAADLASVNKVYIKGTLGVAENGAIWLNESQMINRLLPFICQHLIIVLEKEKIVSTMHQAYQEINAFDEGFGVFIAGPSKTADIEQSLVIGAHGPRRMSVYLVNGN